MRRRGIGVAIVTALAKYMAVYGQSDVVLCVKERGMFGLLLQ
jgi:ribosomal protein S18 acetylase RimI-like enzyme